MPSLDIPQITATGYVFSNPEYTPAFVDAASGIEKAAICTFTLYTQPAFRNKSGKFVRKQPLYWNVITFGDQAEEVAYLRDGDRVLVTGEPQKYTEWETVDGKLLEGMEIRAEEVGQLLSKSKSASRAAKR